MHVCVPPFSSTTPVCMVRPPRPAPAFLRPPPLSPPSSPLPAARLVICILGMGGGRWGRRSPSPEALGEKGEGGGVENVERRSGCRRRREGGGWVVKGAWPVLSRDGHKQGGRERGGWEAAA